VPYVIKTSDNRIVAGGGDGSLLATQDIFSRNGTVSAFMGGHSSALNTLRLVNGRAISGSLDHSLCIWGQTEAGQFELIKHLPDHHSNVVRKISADHFRILSAGYDGNIIQLDFLGGEPPAEQEEEKTCVIN
jgi:hypothetical protein